MTEFGKSKLFNYKELENFGEGNNANAEYRSNQATTPMHVGTRRPAGDKAR